MSFVNDLFTLFLFSVYFIFGVKHNNMFYLRVQNFLICPYLNNTFDGICEDLSNENQRRE